MCGIAGFSLNSASKINARALAHALLAQIEARGAMSSGIAFPNSEGGISVYKDAVAGSNLPLKDVPRNTKTAILHTRYATKGSPSVNANNHPVWSPNGTIALVHNGVIWNDMSLRFGSLKDVDDAGLMPDVDTACIPALLEAKGIPGIKELAGDAAVAWLDVEDPHELHLARIESSPVSYTNLADGSFVFASTPHLLRQALASLGLEHGEVFNFSELDYYRLRGGVIWKYAQMPETTGYGYGLASSTRGATSGGHSTTTSRATGKRSTYYGTGSTWGERPNAGGSMFTSSDEGDVATEVVDVDTTDATDAELAVMEARAMALLEAEVDKVAAEEATTTVDPDNRTIVSIPFRHPEIDEGEEGFKAEYPQYFTIDTDRNIETYDTLEELETKLLYVAGRAGETPFGEGKVKWVNYFSDIGQFDMEDGDLISWIDEPGEVNNLVGDLDYVKDGVSLLAGMAGR